MLVPAQRGIGHSGRVVDVEHLAGDDRLGHEPVEESLNVVRDRLTPGLAFLRVVLTQPDAHFLVELRLAANRGQRVGPPADRPGAASMAFIAAGASAARASMVRETVASGLTLTGLVPQCDRG